MGKISEPEWWNTPILTAFDSSDTPFSFSPVQINHKTYQTGPRGTLSLKELVNTTIESLFINWTKITIPKGKLKVSKTLHLNAHVKWQVLEIL